MYRQPLCCCCFFPDCQKECYKLVIEVLGELLRMGSDENVHQSQLLALGKARVVTQLRTHPPSVAICEMAQLKHSCCHTSYTAICILCTLCVSSPQCGLCGECMRHTRSAQRWGQDGACKDCWKPGKSMGM